MIKKIVDKTALKDKMGRKYSCSLELIDKKNSPKQIICKGCGTILKSNMSSNYCSKCKEIFYDEP